MNTTRGDKLAVNQPTLPKGGGAIKGMGEALGEVGMTGLAGLSVPLPISAGRGYAPALSLSYSSGAGNGAFGIGWDASPISIRRRTSDGVPLYESRDAFLGPDGEVLVPETGDDQQPVVATVSRFRELALDQAYRVTRFLPCVEGAFSRIERWSPTAGTEGDFWLIHGADGELLCLGKSAQSRIADPADPGTRIGAWLLEESVNLTGEHICYEYRAENTDNVSMDGHEAGRAHTARRYLVRVAYGNVSPYGPLYAWQRHADAEAPRWLFTLVFDHGERPLDPMVAPPWQAGSSWPCRPDAFSDFALGFEVRTHRLCRQVLMFHHFPRELGQEQTLVRRLMLDYAQSPRMTELVGAQVFAYESDGRVQSLPPLSFSYTPFVANFDAANYAAMPSFPALNDGTTYQMVDLFGEGLPGVLYQVGNDWRYQAPMRGGGSPDAVAYSAWQPLPRLPSLLEEDQGRQTLTDLTGDGRLDWVVAHPSLAGYFTLNPDRGWSRFVPYPAFPAEFLQGAARFADLIGAGLSDLALIGPKSVRLYPNLRQHGFGRADDVAHDGDDGLPMAAGDAATLVAFSDVLGSGQQHLVQVRHDQLKVWPNLGRGRFGAPLVLASLPFDRASFNPERVFLADLDGSGAADLVYAESDRFLIFMNQSGNGFQSAPDSLPMPAGVRFDQLSQLSFADVDGSGTTSLVLSVPHMAPRHWRYNFAPAKPYLLRACDNHMGAINQFTYRSSAQEWLDEKQASPGSASQLPFAMQLVSSVTSLDEINGNRLVQRYLYRRGVYDGLDRELRGFGFVQHLDTQDTAMATTPDAPQATPTLTRTWYSTGQEAEGPPPRDFAPSMDPGLFNLGPTRLTRLAASGDDEPFVPDDETRRQMYRALKGRVNRQEIYGQDGDPRRGVPYSVQTGRVQVRLVQAMASPTGHCVVLPLSLEQLNVTYERIAADPLVRQQITLKADAFGAPLRRVAVSYGRRPKGGANPYPASVPDRLWASSYDDEQLPLRLVEDIATVFNLTTRDDWRLALPYEQRQNVLTYAAGYDGYPASATGLSCEALDTPGGLLDSTRPRAFAGQTVTFYFDAAGSAALPVGAQPPRLALVHHVETAELDDQALAAYADIPLSELGENLVRAGYLEGGKVLCEPGETATALWTVQSGYATYVDQGQWLPFQRPRSMRSTAIVAPRRFTYDAHSCVVESVTDGVGNRVRAQYDYRFLSPWRVIDPNENTQEALFDALGRVVATSSYGTERDDDGKLALTGFDPVSDFNPKADALASIDAALADPARAIQRAAAVYLYDTHSWMASRRPVQSAVFEADQHPDAVDPKPQIQIAMSHSDGFGRALQSKKKCPPGLACVVTPAGELELDGSGKPVERDTGDAARWAVSGRVEYDNKGQVIRVYQPYFIDRASHVNDAQARSWGHADTHAYDPLGREVAVITALGHKRRTSYFPWFDMSEDENDTLGDVSPSTAIEGKATPNMPITRGAFPSSIAIANAGTVGTLGVTVELTYTSGAFVRVELTSPAGQTVALPNVHSSPDDQVLSHVSTEQSSPLSPFIGQDMQGSWTLKISEFGSTREMRGIFSRWSLTITPADAARRHPQ